MVSNIDDDGDSDGNVVSPILQIQQGRLFERDSQIDVLRRIARGIREEGAKTQVCFISGDSGSGKTALCETLMKDCIALHQQEQGEQRAKREESPHNAHRDKYRFDESNMEGIPIFISGKAGQYEDFSAPYAVIVDAFDQLGHIMIHRLRHTKNRSSSNSLQNLLKKSSSFEKEILTELIPSFAGMVEGTRSDNQRFDTTASDGAGFVTSRAPSDPSEEPSYTNEFELAQERLSVTFRSFLRILCTPDNPIILHVDDLQWSDPNSLDVLKAIIDDPGITNFLFLGSYRIEEEGKIRLFLDHLEESIDSQSMIRIHLVGLRVHGIKNLVADVLSWDVADPSCDELSNLLLERTSGNPYYLLQLLMSLNRERLLTFNKSSMRWEVDIEKVRIETQKLDNVAFFVAKRIRGLRPSTRRVLSLASCIGFSANIELLEILNHFSPRLLQRPSDRMQLSLQGFHSTSNTKIYDVKDLLLSARSSGDLLRSSREEVNEAIVQGQEEGLIAITNNNILQFTHDRIQEGFYSLLTEDRQAGIHFNIGQTILEVWDVEPNRQDLLFLAADQCNRGSKAVENEEQRIFLMNLNLRASKVAQAKAGVGLVSKFLEKAIELVVEEDWSGINYELVLDIFNLSAEVESARGVFDQCEKRIKTIIEKSRTNEDTVRAIGVHALSLGTRQDYLSALVEANTALKILGVHVPRQMRKFRLYTTLVRLNKKMNAMSDVDLMKLPKMHDPRMVLAMKVLQAAHMWGWNVDIILGRLATLEMMKVTLEKGICNFGPCAIAGFGNLVATVLQDEAAAFRLALMSKRLDELTTKDGTPSRIMISHCYLFHLRQPISASLEPFLKGYRLSLRQGDITNGAICLCNYLWVYLFCGLPLDVFVSDMRMYLSELKLCQQDFLLAFLLPDFLLGLVLTGMLEEEERTISWHRVERMEGFAYNASIAEQHPAHLKLLYAQIFIALILDDGRDVQRGLDSVMARKPIFRRFDGTHHCNQFFTVSMTQSQKICSFIDFFFALGDLIYSASHLISFYPLLNLKHLHQLGGR